MLSSSKDSQTTTPTSPSNCSARRFENIKVLGVCGGIGSGKSMASKLLVSELGCVAHIDTDSMAHQVYQPGSLAVKDVVREFGVEILSEQSKEGTEEIDRKKLGRIVFADRSAMSKLERLVWPHVKVMIEERLDELNSQHDNKNKNNNNTTSNTTAVVVLEAAVLLDAAWEDLLDGIWVVTAPTDVAAARLVENRGFSLEDAQQRLAAQVERRGIGNLHDEVAKGIVTGIVENKGNEQEELVQALRDCWNNPKSWKAS